MTDDDEMKRARDDARCQVAVQTLVDVLLRYEQLDEGTHTAYDVLSYAMEDLIREGLCAACLQDALVGACNQLNVDPGIHQSTEGTVH